MRAALLLLTATVVLLWVGWLFGAQAGLMIALGLAVVLNGAAYFVYEPDAGHPQKQSGTEKTSAR